MKRPVILFVFALLLSFLCRAEEAAPGGSSLSNELVETTWQFTDKGTLSAVMTEKKSKESLRLEGDLFRVIFSDGSALSSSAMTFMGKLRLETLVAKPDASRFSERLPGHEIIAELVSPDHHIYATWRAIVRDGSDYLRQEVTLRAADQPAPLKEIVLFDLPVADARSTGQVEGSPLATSTMFFAVENPLSSNVSKDGRIRGSLPHGADLAPGETVDCSEVIGFVRKGQLRRDFLAYLERERAHPYRTFLNYNTWFDIGYNSDYDEAALTDAIEAFDKELVRARHVKIDSFLLDDGWDDHRTLWRPHAGFPNGFGSAARTAAEAGGALGFWLSPWGGYAQAKEERVAAGKKEGFEIVNGSFSMAGPKYYERFRSLCVDVIRQYGVNQFKFDGIGAGVSTGPGSSARDFAAMLKLDKELHAQKPGLFINQTTGTWPSPFWTFWADSIWRGGADSSFAGTGSKRQQWITYRDGAVYERVVQQGELYPLNSLMLHGIIYAKRAEGLNTDPSGDFTSEVRSFFGSGTQMQELYITPKLLTAANWDALAESARWSRANADVLRDTHWVGGDPLAGQIYGWASWSPRKGILTLRNPSGEAGTIGVDVAKIFELTEEAPQDYELVSPYADQRLGKIALKAGEAYEFTLQPYEVLVFDAHAKSTDAARGAP